MIPARIPSVWMVFDGKMRYVYCLKFASMLLLRVASVQSYRCQPIKSYSLGVAVAWHDAALHALYKSSELPCSRSTFRVTTETLLRHDGYDVTNGTVEARKNIVPNVRLICFL